MSRSNLHPLALRPVVLRLESMAAIAVTRDVPFDRDLTLDVYHPDAPDGTPPPVVLLVTGYPDVDAPRPLGCAFKEMAVTVSWSRLLAASGIAAVMYSARAPEADALAVLRYLRDHRAALGVDASRVALWATSGHVPLALGLLLREPAGIAAAVLSSGFMFDVDGTATADASREYRFANPIEGRHIAELPRVPLLVVRSGGDQFAGLNTTIDRFVADALALDRPLTLINHPGAPHAFEIHDDSPATHAVIRAMIEFLRRLLVVERPEVAEVTDPHGAAG